jgi:hypothetical protein
MCSFQISVMLCFLLLPHHQSQAFKVHILPFIHAFHSPCVISYADVVVSAARGNDNVCGDTSCASATARRRRCRRSSSCRTPRRSCRPRPRPRSLRLPCCPATKTCTRGCPRRVAPPGRGHGEGRRAAHAPAAAHGVAPASSPGPARAPAA